MIILSTLAALLSLAVGFAIGRLRRVPTSRRSRRNFRNALIILAVTVVALIGALAELFREGNLLVGSKLSLEGYLIDTVGFIFLADKVLGLGEASDRDANGEQILEQIDASHKSMREIAEEVRGRIARMPSFTDFHNVRYFPNRTEALRHCADLCKVASKIKNTVFRHGHPAAADPDDEAYRQWLDAKLSALNREGAPAEIHEIVCDYLPQNDPQMRFMGEAKKAFGYRPRLVDDRHCPLLNLTVIEAERSEKEVIFGWDFGDSVFGRCFSSRERALVEYFEAYFDELSG